MFSIVNLNFNECFDFVFKDMHPNLGRQLVRNIHMLSGLALQKAARIKLQVTKICFHENPLEEKKKPFKIIHNNRCISIVVFFINPRIALNNHIAQ